MRLKKEIFIFLAALFVIAGVIFVSQNILSRSGYGAAVSSNENIPSTKALAATTGAAERTPELMIKCPGDPQCAVVHRLMGSSRCEDVQFRLRFNEKKSAAQNLNQILDSSKVQTFSVNGFVEGCGTNFGFSIETSCPAGKVHFESLDQFCLAKDAQSNFLFWISAKVAEARERLRQKSIETAKQRPNEQAPTLEFVECPPGSNNESEGEKNDCVAFQSADGKLKKTIVCPNRPDEYHHEPCAWSYFQDGGFIMSYCKSQNSIDHDCYLQLYDKEGNQNKKFNSLFPSRSSSVDASEVKQGTIGSIKSIKVLPNDLIEIEGDFHLKALDDPNKPAKAPCQDEDCADSFTKAKIYLNRAGQLVQHSEATEGL